MTAASEYDRRQYRLMLKRLDEFRAGKIQIRRLIDDFRALVDVLEGGDARWKEDVLAEWGTLEVIYAVAADRAEQTGEASYLSDEELRQVQRAVENLHALVDSQLG